MPLLAYEGGDRGLVALAGDIFDVPVRPDIVHRVVRWQLAKRRQGSASTKTISEVSGTGRKPHPQKGTGMARQGSRRSPHMRGGSTMHGPKPRSHELGLQKQVRRLGLKCALSARMAEGKLLVFDALEPASARTREMEAFLRERLAGAKKTLLVDGGGASPGGENLRRATANLFYANVLPHQALNVYSILQHDTLILALNAVRGIEERLHTPINR